jgi:hypothetical protein
MEIIRNVVKPSKVQKQTRLWILNTSAIPTLLYDSETLTLKEQDKCRITAVEINFFRKTAEYTSSNHKTKIFREKLKYQFVGETNN